MQICIVSPGPSRLAVTETSITFDGWARPESFSLVASHQGQKKQIVWDKLNEDSKKTTENYRSEESRKFIFSVSFIFRENRIFSTL